MTDDEYLDRRARWQRWRPLGIAAVLLAPLLFGIAAFGFHAAVTGKWPKASHYTTHDKD